MRRTWSWPAPCRHWRNEKLRVQTRLDHYGIVPERVWQDGALGVLPWDRPSGVVTGKAGVTTGRFSVADPAGPGREYGQYGVRRWDEPIGAAASSWSMPGGGWYAVADPRLTEAGPGRHNQFRVIRWDPGIETIIGATRPGEISAAVQAADPRSTGSTFVGTPSPSG